MTITFDDDLLEQVLIEGFDARFGARPLRRRVEGKIQNNISRIIILNKGVTKPIHLFP
jgi:ATP-dependent Clp protease ATP-binding subunit ClpA